MPFAFDSGGEENDLTRAIKRRLAQRPQSDPFAALKPIGDVAGNIGSAVGGVIEKAHTLPVVGGALDVLGAVGDATVSTPVGLAALGADRFLGTGLTGAALRENQGRPFWELPKTATHLASGALGEIASDETQDPRARLLAGLVRGTEQVGSFVAPIPGAGAAGRLLGRGAEHLPGALDHSVGEVAPGAGAFGSRQAERITALRRAPKMPEGEPPNISTDEGFRAQIKASLERQRANPTPPEEMAKRFPISRADLESMRVRGEPIAGEPFEPHITTDDTLAADLAASLRARGVEPRPVEATPVASSPTYTRRAPSIQTNEAELRQNALRQRISGPEPTGATAPETALGERMLSNESGIVAAAARGEPWVTPELLKKHYANEALVNAAKSGDVASAREALATLESLGASASNTASHLRTAGVELPRGASFAHIREALMPKPIKDMPPLAEAIRARIAQPEAPTPSNVIPIDSIREIKAKNAVTLEQLRQRIAASRAEAAGPPSTPPSPAPPAPIGQLARRLETKGGFTYNPRTTGFPDRGYAVSPFKDREFVAPYERAKASTHIHDYIAANRDLLTQEGAHLGAWIEHGRVYLDVSILSQDAAQAERVALAHGQKAYFDLKKKETVYVRHPQGVPANPAQRLATGDTPPRGGDGAPPSGGSGQEPGGPQGPGVASASGWDHFLSVWNLPKSLKASLDISAPFRQGILLSAGHPGEFFGAFKPMLQAFRDSKFAAALDAQLRAVDRPGLYLAPIDTAKLGTREEAFMSNFAEKIPGVSASNRAYVAFLNKLRADVYDNVAQGWETGGKLNDANRVKELRGLADVINHLTGRGDLPLTGETGTAVLNGMFFSPRFAISRVQSVGDALSGLRPGASLASREATADMAKFVGAGLTILTLAQLAGAKVGGDPRSPDFGKIQVGNTSVDIWGGEQQFARYGAQLITGQRVTASGKNAGQVQDQPRGDTLQRFVRSKLAPTTGTANDILGLVGGGGPTAKDRKENATRGFGDQVIGRDFIGQPVTPKTIPGTLTAPLGWQDVIDAAQAGSGPLGALSLLGFGVQTNTNAAHQSVPSVPLGGGRVIDLGGARPPAPTGGRVIPLEPSKRGKVVPLARP